MYTSKYQNITHTFLSENFYTYFKNSQNYHITQASYATHFSFVRVAHPYEWHDPLTCVAWLIDTCDMIHSSGRLTNEKCHICLPDEWIMSHISMSHATHVNGSCHTYGWAVSHVRMSHATHTKQSYLTHEWVTHTNNGSCHPHEWVWGGYG